jgi:hypothetical protein
MNCNFFEAKQPMVSCAFPLILVFHHSQIINKKIMVSLRLGRRKNFSHRSRPHSAGTGDHDKNLTLEANPFGLATKAPPANEADRRGIQQLIKCSDFESKERDQIMLLSQALHGY